MFVRYNATILTSFNIQLIQSNFEKNQKNLWMQMNGFAVNELFNSVVYFGTHYFPSVGLLVSYFIQLFEHKFWCENLLGSKNSVVKTGYRLGIQ